MLGLDLWAGLVPVNMYKMFYSMHRFERCLLNEHIARTWRIVSNLHIDELHTFFSFFFDLKTFQITKSNQK